MLDEVCVIGQAANMLSVGELFFILHIMVQIAVVMRVLEHPRRQPTSRIAWLVVVLALPLVGIIAYLMLGETNIGRRNREAMLALADVRKNFSAGQEYSADNPDFVPTEYAHLFSVGYSISGFPAVAGNQAELMADSLAAIESIVSDIDAARSTVDVLFYIWLTDGSGVKVAEALTRAAARGVACRAMVDGLGSRKLLRSKIWKKMSKAGVSVAVALPLGNPILSPLQGRVDLRNHRKIVVVDGDITYCGSQNCADDAFRIKAKFAPWVDLMVRFTGPVAQQNQALFDMDWAVYAGEEVEVELPTQQPVCGDIVAQVVASGPILRYSAMPELFLSLIYRSRRELVISTPYYVPTQAMQEALCASAYRGVLTTLILPARNDSREVAAASRSYYAQLLESGVHIHEYQGGLLHSKSLTLDGDITLVGSANMDQRSFDLNFENNILIYSTSVTASVRERQQVYLDSARVVTLEEVANWPLRRRLWNNAVAMMGPIL